MCTYSKNKKWFFFHIGHYIANASNLVPHLTCYYLMFAILYGGPRSKFLGTNLDSFEWSILNPLVGPCLGPWFSKIMNFLLSSFLWFELIDFPSKMEPCRCGLDLPLLGLAPSSKGCGSNLWLPANKIVLFH